MVEGGGIHDRCWPVSPIASTAPETKPGQTCSNTSSDFTIPECGVKLPRRIRSYQPFLNRPWKLSRTLFLFWIFAILAIAWVVKAASAGDGKNEQKPKSPLEILEERFARGEIDEEGFERKRKLLRG